MSLLNIDCAVLKDKCIDKNNKHMASWFQSGFMQSVWILFLLSLSKLESSFLEETVYL